jgi:hypothetical protein
VQARADQQEGQGRRRGAEPGRAGAGVGEHDQREGHDRQAAELGHAAAPDVGHAAPAEQRAVVVGAEADQRAQRREQQRQRHHQGDQPGGLAHLQHHHPVQGAVEQHQRHADADLEQGQARRRPRGRSPLAASAKGTSASSAPEGKMRRVMRLQSHGGAARRPGKCRNRN